MPAPALQPSASAARALQRLQRLALQVRSEPRLFIPAQQGLPRLGLAQGGWLLAAALGWLALLSLLMRELYARVQDPLPALGAIAVLLLPSAFAFLRAYERALARCEAAEAAMDATARGWWLEVPARRLVPQHWPGQAAIDLDPAAFSVAVGGGSHRSLRWATLELRHRHGHVVELGRWRLTGASLRSQDYAGDAPSPDQLRQAVEALAEALAERMALRRV